VEYTGRVLRVVKTVENRNHSVTLDYSDWRSTDCTWALVWLGEHGIPGARGGSEPRELDIHEQIGVVDCTNLFGWMDDTLLAVEVDANLDPRAELALLTWETFEKARIAREAREVEALVAKRAEAARVAQAAKAAKDAKKQAKLNATAVDAEAEMAKVMPLKGKRVTLKSGFQGTLFWVGVKAYRGVNSCRIGVRSAVGGDVEWAAASDIAA
jgi:hypothetical protein